MGDVNERNLRKAKRLRTIRVLLQNGAVLQESGQAKHKRILNNKQRGVMNPPSFMPLIMPLVLPLVMPLVLPLVIPLVCVPRGTIHYIVLFMFLIFK